MFDLRHTLIALLCNLPAVTHKIVKQSSMAINIYLYLILDKLGLDNEHSFVNMIIKVHIFMFSWYKTFYRNTSTNMNILTNIHSGTLISIHEQEALVATFMYCYISILYSNSCIPSMHFLPSLSLTMMKLTSRTKHNKNQLICNFILLCEKYV